MNKLIRCKWAEHGNDELMISYHDKEWCKINHDDRYIFEMLILEGFQAGLSWKCIIDKREAFKEAFDNFDYQLISQYNQEKLDQLASNKAIVRNKLKIKAAVTNASAFMEVQKEFGSFDKYIWSFSDNKQIVNRDGIFRATSELSDAVSKDLIKRGFKFVGSTIIYSFLQSIGIIDDHEPYCFCCKND